MNTVYLISDKVDAYDFLKNTLKQKFNIEKTIILRSSNGKPYFKDLNTLQFNISNSHGLQAVAIGDCEVGVDIEKIRKADLRVAKRFTQSEREYILEQDSQKRFFEVWTKKEAYLKYKGIGLKGGLDSFSVFDISEKITTFAQSDFIISVCSDKKFKLEVQNEIQ